MKEDFFDDLLKPCRDSRVTSVAGGADISVLKMVKEARETQFILVDEREAVRRAARPLNENPEDWDNCRIVEPENVGVEEAEPEQTAGKEIEEKEIHSEKIKKNRSGAKKSKAKSSEIEEAKEARLCRRASELCLSGEAGVLMKGRVHTAAFLRAFLKRESGMLKPGSILSHVALFSPSPGSPSERRSFLVTDSAVNVSPNLEGKKRILANAIRAARAIGVEKPFIALLAPVEVPANHIQSTIDARDLKEWLMGGALGDCVADGPLALDVAASVDASRIKGVNSPVAGRTDVYLAPNLDSGNILYKALSVFAGFRVAAVLLGVSVPVVLTSRSDDSKTRRASLGLALRIAASPVWDDSLSPGKA